LKLALEKDLPKTKKPAGWAGHGSASEIAPALAVSNLSFEHVLQHVELAGLFSTSSEGMSATTATRPVIV